MYSYDPTSSVSGLKDNRMIIEDSKDSLKRCANFEDVFFFFLKLMFNISSLHLWDHPIMSFRFNCNIRSSKNLNSSGCGRRCGKTKLCR